MAKIVNKMTTVSKANANQPARPTLKEGSYIVKELDLEPSVDELKGKQSLNYRNDDRPVAILVTIEGGEFVFWVSEGLQKACIKSGSFNYYINIKTAKDKMSQGYQSAEPAMEVIGAEPVAENDLPF